MSIDKNCVQTHEDVSDSRPFLWWCIHTKKKSFPSPDSKHDIEKDKEIGIALQIRCSPIAVIRKYLINAILDYGDEREVWVKFA